MTGGYFYYGPDNFLTSRSYPADMDVRLGVTFVRGDSFVRDTGCGRWLERPGTTVSVTRAR